jgi:hypothetical protein
VFQPDNQPNRRGSCTYPGSAQRTRPGSHGHPPLAPAGRASVPSETSIEAPVTVGKGSLNAWDALRRDARAVSPISRMTADGSSSLILSESISAADTATDSPRIEPPSGLTPTSITPDAAPGPILKCVMAPKYKGSPDRPRGGTRARPLSDRHPEYGESRVRTANEPPSRGAIPRFYVAGPFVRMATDTDGSRTVIGGPFHAKEMGTNQTACGLGTESWVKVWEVPFADAPKAVCPECAAIARFLDGNGKGRSL